MELSFEKSNLDKTNHYKELYSKCFSNHNKSLKYYEWLYKQNPNGSYIGVDCIYDNEIIGQVGGIPFPYNYEGKICKVLLSINVCVSPDHQGKKIFNKLAQKLESYAKEEKFKFIIAIANKSATPAWIKSISMQNIGQLNASIGYGNYGLKKLRLEQSDFFVMWNKKTIEWRINNPENKINLINLEKKSYFLTNTNINFLKIFSILDWNNFDKNNNKKHISILPKLFVGLIPKKKTNFLSLDLPNFLRPSPLNFLYKDLSGNNNKIEKEKCFFSFLDFDAF